MEAGMEAEESGNSKSRAPWIVAIVVVVGLLAAAGIFGLPQLSKYFVRRYYEQSYSPTRLLQDYIGKYPTEHLLEGVPWVSTVESLCQSTSVQMIAAYYGLDQSRRLFDFLMGFTYGASEVPGQGTFFPGGTDPEVGFRDAAPFFGRSARYFVTDDPDLYLRGLRYYLSQGFPVRVALDFAVLYEMDDQQIAHSEVLVGYDAEGFHYYEPVCVPEAPCEPGVQDPGGKGLYVADQLLLDAVLAQSEIFDYPWQYAFTIFEPGTAAEDLRPVWQRNGLTSIGDTTYGPKQGAEAIELVADQVEKEGEDMDLVPLRQSLDLAVYVRQENAVFLREVFHGDEDLDLAADLLDQAAQKYQMALDATEDEIADETEAATIAGWLREAAAAERQVGGIYLNLGK